MYPFLFVPRMQFDVHFMNVKALLSTCDNKQTYERYVPRIFPRIEVGGNSH